MIQFLGTDKIELYNLKNDISEENNLATKETSKTAELLTLLKSWKKEYLVPERLDVLKRNKKGKNKKKN